MGAEYADGDCHTPTSVLDGLDENWHLEVLKHLEEDNVEVDNASDNLEPAGTAVGTENDEKTGTDEKNDNHMKETDEKNDSHMKNDSVPIVTSISVVSMVTPIYEPASDKTSEAHRNKTYHEALLGS